MGSEAKGRAKGGSQFGGRSHRPSLLPRGAPWGEQEAFPFGKVRSEKMSRKPWDTQVLHLVEKLVWKGVPGCEPGTAEESGVRLDRSRGGERGQPERAAQRRLSLVFVS